MNIKKISEFLKKHAFYVAVGIISAGALGAIFLIPSQEGNIANEPNPYAQNEETTVKVPESITDGMGDIVLEYPEESGQKTSQTPNTTTEDTQIASSEDATPKDKVVKEEEIIAETFESTTANAEVQPYFAEGDTFIWPVVGEVVVPYTDESTKHWFSESLNQTMRTFGICIASQAGESVKAAADGKVIEIVDDSSTLDLDLPYVGKLMILDHGNGYKSLYGFQNGTLNKDLLGKSIQAGEVLGTVGTPAGAFIAQGENIYLQATHNDKSINPLNLLDYKQALLDVEGVDMGHTPDRIQ